MGYARLTMRHSPNARSRWRAAASALGAIALLAGLTGGVGAQSPAAFPVVPSAGTPSAGAPAPSPAPDALTVVTTTTVFADILRNIAGEHADVVSIIPAGVGPEDYEPTPADALLLAEADLIVSNGVGLDDFLLKLLESGTGGQTPRLVLGEGIPALTVDGELNPHFWLDPTLVAQHYVPTIIGALSTVDPDHGGDYGTNGADFTRRLVALDGQLQTLVATIPEGNRKLVTFHDAFPYLAQHYGFELVGVILENVGAEPTAAELAALVDKVRSAGVTAVFSEAQFNPELAQTLAQEAGISSIVTNLYTDSLGEPPADTYLGMMQTDIERIAAALR